MAADPVAVALLDRVDPSKTDDGRYVVINGQKWRASDPDIPEQLRAELVKELMATRRLVKTRGDEVSFRVHDAKVALGERGENWRDLMSLVREVAAALSDQGEVRITQKGRPVDSHAKGTIRLAPGDQLRH